MEGKESLKQQTSVCGAFSSPWTERGPCALLGLAPDWRSRERISDSLSLGFVDQMSITLELKIVGWRLVFLRCAMWSTFQLNFLTDINNSRCPRNNHSSRDVTDDLSAHNLIYQPQNLMNSWFVCLHTSRMANTVGKAGQKPSNNRDYLCFSQFQSIIVLLYRNLGGYGGEQHRLTQN